MPRLHPHLLRYLCATSKLRDGMGVGEFQRMLGHESIQTTMRYVHLAGEDVRRAHKRAASVERVGINEENRHRCAMVLTTAAVILQLEQWIKAGLVALGYLIGDLPTGLALMVGGGANRTRVH